MDQLHPSVEALVRRIIDDGKPFDWFIEFGAVAELNRLASEQDGPPSRDLVALLDTPLLVGNVSLSRLSWSAIEFYNGPALTWWRDKPALRDIALAWAHANSRDPAEIRSMSTRETFARKRLQQWSAGLTAPWEAIQAAVDVLLPKPTKMPGFASGEPVAARSQHSLLAFLVTTTGLKDDHWLFAVSYDQVVDALREIGEATFAEQARMAALLGVRLSEPENSWSFQSFIRFRNASKAFMDRHGVDTSARKRKASVIDERDIS